MDFKFIILIVMVIFINFDCKKKFFIFIYYFNLYCNNIESCYNESSLKI